MAKRYHKINKEKVLNDIVLTISLIVSVLLIRFIMHISGIENTDYRNAFFFVSSFICIKLIYNIIMRVIKYSL